MNPETEFREGLDELAAHYKEVLKLLGEDPEREGLVKTPMRVAKAMQILTRGYSQPGCVRVDAGNAGMQNMPPEAVKGMRLRCVWQRRCRY